MSEVGHNSGLDKKQQDALKSIIERVEETEGQIKSLREEQKETYSEGAAFKLNPKIIRKIVALRKQDGDKRRAEAEILELYKRAVGLD
jgi:uncharacterized protein (UPF0335 family)